MVITNTIQVIHVQEMDRGLRPRSVSRCCDREYNLFCADDLWRSAQIMHKLCTNYARIMTNESAGLELESFYIV
jgi:hypothetical protein